MRSESDRDPIDDERLQAIETDDIELEIQGGAPPFPPLNSMVNLFKWYERHFCRGEIVDCRNFRVAFCEEDFVHLVKIVDRYGREPKNRADTIRRIKAGEFKMFNGTKHSPANFSVRRAKDLACIRSVIQDPWMIVPNWQPLGKANPGEAYIRDFGKAGRRRFRVLICGIAGRRRSPVTMFPRQRFAAEEILIKLWP
jgi:hypothetical protein